MITLDDRIIVSFSGQDVEGHNAGMYVYYVFRNNQTTSGSTRIFAGNFYYNGSDSAITFDITDIIRSDGYVITEDKFKTTSTFYNKIVDRYFITVEWGNGDYINSNAQLIAKTYSYNNKKLWNDANNYITPSYNVDAVRILLQGFKTNTDSVLIPHYPMFPDEQAQSTNSCPFAISLLVGNNVSSVTASFEVGNESFDTTITPNGRSFTHII